MGAGLELLGAHVDGSEFPVEISRARWRPSVVPRRSSSFGMSPNNVRTNEPHAER